jgi:hypothetical protein
MRVALCIHGHFRSFDRVYANLQRNLIDIYKPDIFAAAWMDNTGDWLPRTHTPDPVNHPGFRLDTPQVSNAYVSSVIQTLNPKDLHLDHYWLHDQNLQHITDQYIRFNPPDPNHAPKSALSMNYIRFVSIASKWVQEQRQGWKYDCVINTRWDVDHKSPIDLSKLDLSKIETCRGGSDDHPGDIWAASNSGNMDIWGNQWVGIQELVDANTFSLGPHQWQTAWLKHKNITWTNRTDLDISVLR